MNYVCTLRFGHLWHGHKECSCHLIYSAAHLLPVDSIIELATRSYDFVDRLSQPSLSPAWQLQPNPEFAPNHLAKARKKTSWHLLNCFSRTTCKSKMLHHPDLLTVDLEFLLVHSCWKPNLKPSEAKSQMRPIWHWGIFPSQKASKQGITRYPLDSELCAALKSSLKVVSPWQFDDQMALQCTLSQLAQSHAIPIQNSSSNDMWTKLFFWTCPNRWNDQKACWPEGGVPYAYA